MPPKTSDGMVHPRTVLESVLQLQRDGARAAMEHLEQTEPDLANYLFESLATLYHELVALRGSPARTRRVYRQIELVALVCIQSLRQSHYELWKQQMENPPGPAGSGEIPRSQTSLIPNERSSSLDLADALKIVLDLARQNVIDETDLPEEHARQTDAIGIVERFAATQSGND